MQLIGKCVRQRGLNSLCEVDEERWVRRARAFLLSSVGFGKITLSPCPKYLLNSGLYPHIDLQLRGGIKLS